MAFINEYEHRSWECLLWLVVFWGILTFLHMIFGRNRRSGRGVHAVEGAAAGGVVAGAPGAATGAGLGALAPAGGDSWSSKSYDSARALRDAILLLLVPLLLIRFGSGYWAHSVYAVVVAFTVIALVWALIRGFLHRFADFVAWPILLFFAWYLFYRAFRGDTD